MVKPSNSSDKPDEQTLENGIRNDNKEDTTSSVEPILAGGSGNFDGDGGGLCALSPDERTMENGIRNDKEDETPSSLEPILAGRSGSANGELTSQPVEDATGGLNGEGLCALSPDEIKQIVANFLAKISSESSMKGPSGETAGNCIIDFPPGGSPKYKSRFSRFSSGKKKKASSKLSRSKSSRYHSPKGKSLHQRGESGVSEPYKNTEKPNSTAHASSSKERRRKNKKKFREDVHDVFTKMKKQVRYILNKIKYEQSLIDAYGGEGWKGMSIDKLKPEKELQRASSTILQCKLRLRDLFQHLDTLCAEGAYPKSMFDSQGLLDSEDIYCTICNSKEISADNDIVLCDGECNRAFHQLCLKPPLLTEENPPEDQGWLCPGCDCKFDCTEMLNDFFGSDLSVKDSWTSIFPEASATAAGSNIIDEILMLPSDDSEDDDFNPDNTDVAEKFEIDKSGEGEESESESASDDSDFSSASEDLGYFINKGLLVGNATDNLEDDKEEDDDYDPDVPDPDNMDVDEKVEIEKSGEVPESTSDESDFSSASEDLCEFINEKLVGNSHNNSKDDDEEEDDDDYDPYGPEPDQQHIEEFSRANLTSDSDFSAELDNEISTINENPELLLQDTELKSHVPGSKKRDSGMLDYKKLYDETYGNTLSDSSDDDEWSEAGPSLKRKDKIKRDDSTILKNNKRSLENDADPIDGKIKLQDVEFCSSKRTGKKLKSSSENGSMAKGARNTLGENATQKLREAFQVNHYPGRAVKEGLAKDLGISYQKVDKWFGNARWSYNHPLHARTVSKSNMATSSPSQSKPGSEVAVPIPNNSSSISSQKLPGANATVKGTPSPLIPRSANVEGGKPGQSKKLCSQTSSATNTTIQGDASKTPSQPIKRSSRLQGSCTNKESLDSDVRGSANGGESSRQSGKAPTTNTKQRGKRAASAKS